MCGGQYGKSPSSKWLFLKPWSWNNCTETKFNSKTARKPRASLSSYIPSTVFNLVSMAIPTGKQNEGDRFVTWKTCTGWSFLGNFLSSVLNRADLMYHMKSWSSCPKDSPAHCFPNTLRPFLQLICSFPLPFIWNLSQSNQCSLTSEFPWTLWNLLHHLASVDFPPKSNNKIQ